MRCDRRLSYLLRFGIPAIFSCALLTYFLGQLLIEINSQAGSQFYPSNEFNSQRFDDDDDDDGVINETGENSTENAPKFRLNFIQNEISIDFSPLMFFEYTNLTDRDNNTNYTVIMKAHSYNFTINEVDICTKRRKDVFILIVVHTHPANYKRRMHIRATWGNQRYYRMVKAVTVFAMGLAVDKPSLQRSVMLESQLYRDIVQKNFMDTYQNLSLKSIMWLGWASVYCPHAFYLVKVDDDILINIFNLARHLKMLFEKDEVRQSTILCHVWRNMRVMRDKGSPWYMSREEMPSDTYPTYCSGSAYILTFDLVPQLYHRSFHENFVWVDDAYVTGFLAQDLNLTHKDLNSLYALSPDRMLEKMISGYGLFGHNPASVDERVRVWRQLLQHRNIDYDS